MWNRVSSSVTLLKFTQIKSTTIKFSHCVTTPPEFVSFISSQRQWQNECWFLLSLNVPASRYNMILEPVWLWSHLPRWRSVVTQLKNTMSNFYIFAFMFISLSALETGTRSTSWRHWLATSRKLEFNHCLLRVIFFVTMRLNVIIKFIFQAM